MALVSRIYDATGWNDKDDITKPHLGWAIDLGERTVSIFSRNIAFDLIYEIYAQGNVIRTVGIVDGEEYIKIKFDMGLFIISKELLGGDKGGAYIIEERNGTFVDTQKVSDSQETTYRKLPYEWSKKIDAILGSLKSQFTVPEADNLKWVKINNLKPNEEVLLTSYRHSKVRYTDNQDFSGRFRGHRSKI